MANLLVSLQALLLLGASARKPLAHGAVYSEKEARVYAQYARAAFCAKEAVEAWRCGDACSEAPVVKGSVRFLGPSRYSKVQAFVAQVPTPSGKCIVAFRGSIKWQNWVLDMNIRQKPWPPSGSGRENASWCLGCYVHYGFAYGYEELRSSLVSALGELRCAEVAIAGHSLGGALATLAALDLRAKLGLRVAPVFTFGNPRVGNPAFVAAYVAAAQRQGVDPPSWRIVHYRDPVPRLPPAKEFWSTVRFEHEPREVYYTSRNSDHFKECEANTSLADGHEDPTCSVSTPFIECLNFDHLEYLNESFRFETRSEQCKEPPAASEYRFV